MTRVLSAAVLLPVVVGTIWFLPAEATFLLALLASILAFGEYCGIARQLGVSVQVFTGGAAVLLVCYAMFRGDTVSDMTSMGGELQFISNFVYLILMTVLIVAGAGSVAQGRPAQSVLADVGATVFAPIYLGLPLGALASVRIDYVGGREAVLLLLAVIVVSDSAQYYTGRAFGRRPLSPTISPKKTVEGAIGGVVFGTLAMMVVGSYVFQTPIWLLGILGAAISLLGIVGDLFESLLKRSAGVKDSSNLIPGHGGVLDRIDSWLFAAPVYYVFVRFVA